jgi:hypothetical protein
MATLVELEPGDILVFSRVGWTAEATIEQVVAWFRERGVMVVMFQDEADLSVVRAQVTERHCARPD